MSTRQGGFTLIELVVALMISVVVVGFIATFIAVPVQSHMAQVRRSDLAASAEAVSYWMSQDVRGALPNSLRAGAVGGRPVVEMIDVAAVTIYRDAGTEGDTLDFAAPDNRFDILGLPAAVATHVVVDNRGTPGRNAYQLANVIAPAGVNVASSTITLTPAFRFVGPSTHRRAFLVSPATAVVRYECDLAARTLRRYDGQPMTAAIAALPAGTPSRLIARDVTGCTFTTRAGNTDHGGLLLIRVTISRVTNGATDTLRVMKQLKVEDAA
ncbi:MAG TPA: type II secretion system protein [Steroidobacteraceae bacterium]|jgi:MSHA biogenesis protein MshO|nr:type II secretion system protein [Steroidobacteraceae bacterium]